VREAKVGLSKEGRRKPSLRAFAVLAVVALLTAQASDTLAQQNSQNLTSEQMRQMFGNQGGSAPELNSVPQTTILEPTAAANPSLPQSRLEQIMTARAGMKLTQFGYDQLGSGRPINLPQVGGVQDDYILGTGDEIVVTLRGQENTGQRVEVDRDGNVMLPRIGPIPAGGRRFGEFRADLLAAIHNAYMSTQAYVSIGRLRQISVMVVGEVGSPGVRILTGLSTPLDAILVSGGIAKSGSLRDVKLIHQGRTISIDFYQFLTSGVGSRQVTLGDGDRIVVPPLRNVAAAAGWVRRPGIYEMAPGQSAISANALQSLAGGLEVRGRYRVGILRVQANGQTQLAPVTSDNALLHDGEILMTMPGADQIVDRATLAGGSALAGSYSVNAGTRLSEILRAPGALGESPYTIFAVISRRDPRTYLRSLIAFSPIGALSGEFDLQVMSGDIVRVFSMRESRLLSQSITDFEARKQSDEELARNPYATDSSDNSDQLTSTTTAPSSQVNLAAAAAGQSQAPGVSVPGGANAAQKSAYLGIASRPEEAQPSAPAPANLENETPATGSVPPNAEVTTLRELASQLDVDTVVLLNFLSDHEVTLDGAVRGPGSYVVGPGINLHDLVMVAGGTIRWADESGVELISTDVNQRSGASMTVRKELPLNSAMLASYIIKPHDELRFKQVFTQAGLGPVTVDGEVRFPGQYKIIRGEHLGDLLKRAGGLTDVAYPYGTVYLRKSVAALEQQSFRRLADEVQNQLLVGMTRTSATTKLDPTAFSAAQTFVQTLRTQRGLGRISVVADPTILAVQPADDPLLEPGDLIYIPQRPSTVSVLGEVLQPGSYPYRPHTKAEEYLAKAGGSTAFADNSLTYIILPDGSAKRLDRSWLPFDSERLPPGSVIVVPRDIAPFEWTDFAINASQIFSQLALAAASLAVISTR